MTTKRRDTYKLDTFLKEATEGKLEAVEALVSFGEALAAIEPAVSLRIPILDAALH